MKKFSELTQEEITAMSKEEFSKISPFEKRSCYDCSHLKAALSWWCRNPDAIKARGTSIPSCIKCPYWSPDWRYIEDQYKTEENGYVKEIILSEDIPDKSKKNNFFQRLFNKIFF